MATLDDILTAQKNGVVAINNLNSTWQANTRRSTGSVRSTCIVGSTTVYQGNGYLVSISVVDKGDGTGFVYDSASTENLDDSARMIVTPSEAGVFQIGLRFENGIVVVPGDKQAIVVSYSVD